MQQKRIEWVDTARFFAMIAVMANHTQFMTAKLDSFVAPFYLNMFSFAAGYVYVHRAGFAAFFRKKLRQLFLPWLFLSLLGIVLGLGITGIWLGILADQISRYLFAMLRFRKGDWVNLKI